MEIDMTDETVKENEKTEAEATTEAPATGTPPVGGPGLTLGDLRLVARIIQISSERGAIRADEMATVGDLYNRLVQWLNSIQPAPKTDAKDLPVPGPAELPEDKTTTEEPIDTGSDEGNTGE
ncbi:uncharacterized protein METZ01_LOCUS508569 [marine metagenome]|jgi:hypothetical protein|uniref:DUF1844 domain-containing protein n=1 Tax=marine metagenome TaxID=408172 RepID=A0A383EHD8_9ZZZZ